MFNLQHVGPKMAAGFVYCLGGGILLGILYMFFSFVFIFADWAFNIVGNEMYFGLAVLGLLLLFYIVGSYLYHKWEN